MTYRLGIEVGDQRTTWATVADSSGGAADTGTFDSIVGRTGDGRLLAGSDLTFAPPGAVTEVVRDFVPLLGQAEPLIVGGTPYGVEALVARLVGSAVDTARARRGGDPTAVVLVHPDGLDPYRAGLLAEASRLAGLPTATTLLVTAAAAAAVGGGAIGAAKVGWAHVPDALAGGAGAGGATTAAAATVGLAAGAGAAAVGITTAAALLGDTAAAAGLGAAVTGAAAAGVPLAPTAPVVPAGPTGTTLTPAGPSGTTLQPAGPSGTPLQPAGPSGTPLQPGGPSGAPLQPAGPSGPTGTPLQPGGSPAGAAPAGPSGTPISTIVPKRPRVPKWVTVAAGAAAVAGVATGVIVATSGGDSSTTTRTPTTIVVDGSAAGGTTPTADTTATTGGGAGGEVFDVGPLLGEWNQACDPFIAGDGASNQTMELRSPGTNLVDVSFVGHDYTTADCTTGGTVTITLTIHGQVVAAGTEGGVQTWILTKAGEPECTSDEPAACGLALSGGYPDILALGINESDQLLLGDTQTTSLADVTWMGGDLVGERVKNV